MPLSPKVVELFDQAKKYFISIGGSESVFLNFVAKLNSNNFTSSRLNDAFEFGYLTKILILPDTSQFFAAYQVSISNKGVKYNPDGTLSGIKVAGGTIILTPKTIRLENEIASMYAVAHEARHALNAAKYLEARTSVVNTGYQKIASAGSNPVNITANIDAYLTLSFVEEAHAALTGYVDFAGAQQGGGH
jgi:hypothetical protein